MFNPRLTIPRRLSKAKYCPENVYSNANRNLHSVVWSSDVFGTSKSFQRRMVWARSLSHAPTGDLKLSQDNILSSPLGVVSLDKKLLHEFVWENLDKWADKTALVCAVTGRSYTYAQLKKFSGRFATTLRKNKLHPGDTIAVVLPNIPEFGIVILGAAEAGLQVTLVNGSYTAGEIDRQLQNSGACAVITVPNLYPTVKESIAKNPNLRLPTIVVEDGTGPVPSGAIRFRELIADGVEEFSKIATTERTNEDTLFLPYSSGTTGVPKGVELSHRNILANCTQLQHPEVFPAYETTSSYQDVIPIILPMFHSFGLSVCLINYLSVGAKLVCLPQFNPEGFLRCLKDFRSNILYVAPPLLLFLANHESVTSSHLESIRYIMSGAAPCGAESVKRLMRRTRRDVIVGQGYGLTETSPATAICRSARMIDLNSVGNLVPSTDIRVVGHDGEDLGKNLGVGMSGEVYIRGPQVMKGYYRNAEATAATMDGEWLKTGDVGRFDERGLLFITDRLKELIKVKGYQVAPAELEEILLSYDKIVDAAVIGQTHERFGEIPRAFVVPRPGVKIDEDEVKAFVAEQVSEYKQLGSVRFVKAIPKSAAGKILRRELKNQ